MIIIIISSKAGQILMGIFLYRLVLFLKTGDKLKPVKLLTRALLRIKLLLKKCLKTATKLVIKHLVWFR